MKACGSITFQRHDQLCTEILVEIRAQLAIGLKVYSSDMARKLHCSEAFVCRARQELVAAGLLPASASGDRQKCKTDEDTIAARIKIVHEAKMARLPYRPPRVGMKQLKKILP